MKKLGVFGGSFDPIHNGHLSLCAQLADALCLDRVILIPTALLPSGAKDLTEGAHRLAMCRLAALSDERILVSDMELRRGGKSYTADTLALLQDEYPDSQLYLFLGTDKFLTVQKWHRFDEIAQSAVLVAGAREPDDLQKLHAHLPVLQEKGAKGMVVPLQVVEVSSTAIRSAAADGQSITGMVPAEVETYIKENGLYRKGETDR